MEENDGDSRKSGPFVVELLTENIHSLHEGSPCRHFGEVTNARRVVHFRSLHEAEELGKHHCRRCIGPLETKHIPLCPDLL